MLKAIIFDVDGTLAETEEVHRKAFNLAFKTCALPWNWNRALYQQLLQVAGGKERIRYFIDQYDVESVPVGNPDRFIHEIHREKTACYARMVANGEVVFRPGVRQLISDAIERGYRLAIATTTSLTNVNALLQSAYGSEYSGIFEVICAGDAVTRKKPAPDIYLLALEMLDLPAEDCLAIEDSRNGLLSSTRAGIATVITPSIYTSDQCFDEAVLITERGRTWQIPCRPKDRAGIGAKFHP